MVGIKSMGTASALVIAAATLSGVVGVAHADSVFNFQSPSGNIACTLGGALDGGVECDVAEYRYRVPPTPADCPLNFGDRFALNPGQPPLMMCHGDTVRVPNARTLDYGQKLSIGTITCDSAQVGITCTDASTGHYFRAARDSYQLH